jgi:hypothetical protein
MENIMSFQKEKFLTGEFLVSSINAGLQTRNTNYPIYNAVENYGKASQNLKLDVKDHLIKYLLVFNESSENDHYENIENLSRFISEKYETILFNQRFRIGVSQKIINLFLKYMWIYGKIKMPYHCPFDSNIKTSLTEKNSKIGLQDWTVLDNLEEYKIYVSLARIKAQAEGLSIPEWELVKWNSR